MLLKKGSSGHQVVELQEGLEALGYELGACDGAFGPATEKEVKKFQAENGLKADGLAGKGTIGKLNELLMLETLRSKLVKIIKMKKIYHQMKN